MKNIRIDLKPNTLLKILLTIIGVLFVLNCIAVITQFLTENKYKEITKHINFDIEDNLPSLYSAIAILIAASLLWFIAYCKKKLDEPHRLWFLLFVVFFFLGIDESLSIHEKLSVYLMSKFPLEGYLYYAWVVPYGILIAILAYYYYFNFLVLLPKKYRKLFILAGGLFVLGAIGIEMIAAKLTFDGIPLESPLQLIAFTIEELLEMLGIAIFIYALLLYIKDEIKIGIELPSKI